MAITPLDLLEEVDQELTRIHGRVLTVLSALKIEKRTRLLATMKKPLDVVKPKENKMPKALTTLHEIVADIAKLTPSAVLGVLVPALAFVAKVVPGISIPSTVLVAVITGAIGVAAFLQKMGL